jgi:hypothetical protein
MDYTEKQKAMINGEVPIENLRTADIKNAMLKAEQKGDQSSYEFLKELYCIKTAPPDCKPHISPDDAKKKLQAMTPWKIDWNED